MPSQSELHANFARAAFDIKSSSALSGTVLENASFPARTNQAMVSKLTWCRQIHVGSEAHTGIEMFKNVAATVCQFEIAKHLEARPGPVAVIDEFFSDQIRTQEVFRQNGRYAKLRSIARSLFPEGFSLSFEELLKVEGRSELLHHLGAGYVQFLLGRVAVLAPAIDPAYEMVLRQCQLYFLKHFGGIWKSVEAGDDYAAIVMGPLRDDLCLATINDSVRTNPLFAGVETVLMFGAAHRELRRALRCQGLQVDTAQYSVRFTDEFEAMNDWMADLYERYPRPEDRQRVFHELWDYVKRNLPFKETAEFKSSAEHYIDRLIKGSVSPS